MPDIFDLYDEGTKVQTGVTSPILIDGLSDDTVYSNYSIAYSGKFSKTPLSFRTKKITNIPVTGVTMSQRMVTMKVGEKKQVTASVIPENATNKNVSYSSENGTIVIISNDGTITAIAEGTANVLVTTDEGYFYDKTAVTVKPA